MTNKEAIKKLKEQQAEFNDTYVDFAGTNEAYNLAIKALEEQDADRWIPVGERTPEKWIDVIVSDKEVSETYSGYYKGNGYWDCDNGTYNNRITHWKPFPKKCYESEEERVMKMEIKCGRRTFTVTEKDRILDNGACYILITQSYQDGWYKCNPTVAKSTFKKLLKEGNIKLSEKQYKCLHSTTYPLYEFVIEKENNNE